MKIDRQTHIETIESSRILWAEGFLVDSRTRELFPGWFRRAGAAPGRSPPRIPRGFGEAPEEVEGPCIQIITIGN